MIKPTNPPIKPTNPKEQCMLIDIEDCEGDIIWTKVKEPNGHVWSCNAHKENYMVKLKLMNIYKMPISVLKMNSPSELRDILDRRNAGFEKRLKNMKFKI